MTIKEMVLDLLVGAGIDGGLKDADFVAGMIGDFYYRRYIVNVHGQFKKNERTAEEIIREMADNLCSRVFNGMSVLVGRKLQSIINEK